MAVITIFCLVILELYAWRRRDIKSPAFIYGLLWIAAILNSLFMDELDPLRTSALLIIISGSLVFQIGFNTGTHIKTDKRQYSIIPNNRTMKGLIAVIILLSIPVVIQYFSFIRGYSGSLYNAIGAADDSLNLPLLFDYYRKITQYIFLCFVTVYWKEPKERQKSLKIYVVTLFLISALAAISVPTRNSILFFALPIVMIWFYTHHTKNRTMILVLTVAAIGFFLIFYIISTGKYWYLYSGNAASRRQIIMKELQIYLSGGVAALSKTWDTHSFSRSGANTFRFLFAVSDRIFGTKMAVPLVNDFANVGGNTITNVFTFYDFYIRDYGVLYALIIQFIVAIIHGVTYKKMLNGDLFNIYISAMLTYPLIMQFFQDQYLSLLSSWLQVIIVGMIVFKTNVFFRRQYDSAGKVNAYS